MVMNGIIGGVFAGVVITAIVLMSIMYCKSSSTLKPVTSNTTEEACNESARDLNVEMKEESKIIKQASH